MRISGPFRGTFLLGQSCRAYMQQIEALSPFLYVFREAVGEGRPVRVEAVLYHAVPDHFHGFLMLM